jgi:isoleucyl-tRNA synthetase
MAFQEVPSRVDVDELERGVLAAWEKHGIFAKTLAQNKEGSQFTFYDGPPYATGKPHYGHILQSAIKDTVLRYKTMRGYYVPRRVGWDCHGLPVETLVEKELGFKTKKDIEEYGIEKFNARCRETVTRYITEFTNTLKRIGRWADYEKPYFTMERDYMESEWWVFKQLWEQDLIYQAFRSTPYCVRCETPLSNFEVSINYKDTTDTAVYVALRANAKRKTQNAKQASDDSVWLLVWTTTPWTLQGNETTRSGLFCLTM